MLYKVLNSSEVYTNQNHSILYTSITRLKAKTYQSKRWFFKTLIFESIICSINFVRDFNRCLGSKECSTFPFFVHETNGKQVCVVTLVFFIYRLSLNVGSKFIDPKYRIMTWLPLYTAEWCSLESIIMKTV